MDDLIPNMRGGTAIQDDIQPQREPEKQRENREKTERKQRENREETVGVEGSILHAPLLRDIN